MSNEKNVCGADTHNGGKCSRPAGWGTDEDDGPCSMHLAETNATAKKRFIEIYESEVITFEAAARKAGASRQTVWRWRQRDEEFDEQVRLAQREQDYMRAEKIEDAMFKRSIDGDASASETIFALKNLRPDRWNDRKEVALEHSGEVSVLGRIREFYSEIEEDE